MIDVYTSLLVFVGVFLAVLGYSVGEALIGFVIGLYVLIRGLPYGKDATLVLMDVSPSRQRINEMREIAKSVHGVRGVMRLDCENPVLYSSGKCMWSCRRGFLWKKRTLYQMRWKPELRNVSKTWS